MDCGKGGRVFLIKYQGFLRKFWLGMFMNSEKRYVVEHSEGTMVANEVQGSTYSKYVEHSEKEKERWENALFNLVYFFLFFST